MVNRAVNLALSPASTCHKFRSMLKLRMLEAEAGVV